MKLELASKLFFGYFYTRPYYLIIFRWKLSCTVEARVWTSYGVTGVEIDPNLNF